MLVASGGSWLQKLGIVLYWAGCIGAALIAIFVAAYRASRAVSAKTEEDLIAAFKKTRVRRAWAASGAEGSEPGVVLGVDSGAEHFRIPQTKAAWSIRSFPLARIGKIAKVRG